MTKISKFGKSKYVGKEQVLDYTPKAWIASEGMKPVPIFEGSKFVRKINPQPDAAGKIYYERNDFGFDDKNSFSFPRKTNSYTFRLLYCLLQLSKFSFRAIPRKNEHGFVELICYSPRLFNFKITHALYHHYARYTASPSFPETTIALIAKVLRHSFHNLNFNRKVYIAKDILTNYNTYWYQNRNETIETT